MLQLWNNVSDDDILDYFSDLKKFQRNYFDLIMCNFSRLTALELREVVSFFNDTVF